MPRKPNEPKITIERMIEMYANQHTLVGLSQEAGISTHRVSAMLREAGVEIRGRGQKPGGAWSYTRRPGFRFRT